jgi:hypothetical protein
MISMTFDKSEYMRQYQARRREQFKRLKRAWGVFKKHAREINTLLDDHEREIMSRAWEVMEQ